MVSTRNLSYSFAGKPPNNELFTYRIAADHQDDIVGSVYPMDFCEKEIKDQFSSDDKLVMTGCVKKHDVSIHLNTAEKRKPQLKIFHDRTVPIEKEKIDLLPHNLPPGQYQWAELKLQVSKPEKESVVDKIKKPFSTYRPLPSTTDRKRTLFGLYRVDNNGQHLYMLQPNLTPMPGNPFLAKTPFNRLMYENLMHIHPEPHHERTTETFLIAQAQLSHIQQGQVDELPGTSASAQYAPALPYRVHPDLRGLQLGAPAIPVRHPSIGITKQDSVDIDLAMQSKKLLEKEKREKDIAKLQERKAELEREKISLQEQKKAAEETTVQQATLSATRSIQTQTVQEERAKSAAAQKSSPKKIALTE